MKIAVSSSLCALATSWYPASDNGAVLPSPLESSFKVFNSTVRCNKIKGFSTAKATAALENIIFDHMVKEKI